MAKNSYKFLSFVSAISGLVLVQIYLGWGVFFAIALIIFSVYADLEYHAVFKKARLSLCWARGRWMCFCVKGNNKLWP